MTYRIDWRGTWDLYKACSTRETAEIYKNNLGQKIKDLKIAYFNEYGRRYDEDLKTHYNIYLEHDSDLEEWETVSNCIFNYQVLHEELNYSDIKIEEKEVV